jgi:hypothetical protein
MERSNNAWLESNKKKIEEIQKRIQEMTFQDSTAGSMGRNLNFMEINWLFNGAISEVTKLQKEVDRLEREAKK